MPQRSWIVSAKGHSAGEALAFSLFVWFGLMAYCVFLGRTFHKRNA
jgi:hypothetical protein